ncbi:MAG: hypothetical protein F6K14_05235 [Symploca sp. SIO2C1]|nr:hypothetical protein [Symploca sp. SIO2C1]
MTLARKGLRQLEYQETKFGWMIRPKPTYSQAALSNRMTLAIQSLETQSPKVLHVTLNIDRPDNWIDSHQTTITPKVISKIIDKALNNGWIPDAGGRAYELEYGVIKHL